MNVPPLQLLIIMHLALKYAIPESVWKDGQWKANEPTNEPTNEFKLNFGDSCEYWDEWSPSMLMLSMELDSAQSDTIIGKGKQWVLASMDGIHTETSSGQVFSELSSVNIACSLSTHTAPEEATKPEECTLPKKGEVLSLEQIFLSVT